MPCRHRIGLAFALGAFSTCLAGLAAGVVNRGTVEFFVFPSGSDTWSGRFAGPHVARGDIVTAPLHFVCGYRG